MGSPEPLRSFVERDMDEDVEVNIDIVRVDDKWDGVDKRKHKSTKPRKHGSVDDADGSDSSGRKRSTSSSRKRVGGSRKADSDRDDYEARKESRSKQVQKQPEDNILDKLSTLYQDEEPENKFESATKYVSRVYSRGEESERKKSISKYSEHNVGVEKVPDRDLRFSERRDDVSEKGHVYAEHGRKLRKRLDESDNAGKADEYVEKSDVTIGNRSDFKMETVRSRSDTLEYQSNEIKSKVLVPVEEKSIKSHDREQRRADSVRNKRGRSKVPKEANKGNDRSSKERFEEYTQPRNPTRDIIDDSERSSNADVKSSNSARTPEKIVKHQYESDTFRRKERGKSGSWDDRSKERDESSGVRNMEQENFKETWNRRQDKETRENETTCGRDVERPHGRFGRKPDAVKTSSKYGISNENYDVIEIQTKAFDYGRDDSRSKFAASSNVIQQSDTKVDEFDYSREERSRSIHESVQYGEVTKDKFMDGGLSKDDNEFQAEKFRGQKVVESNRGIGGQIFGSATLPPYGNQEIGSFNRNASQSVRGNKFGRVGRGRPIARDSQQAGIPMPLVGSPFGPLGVPPPGLMQSLTPNMSPAPGPISHGVFIPPFQPPIIWPGAQGVEMNMLGVPPGLPSVLTGPLGPRFPPNLGNPPSVSVFNPAGPGRGMSSSMSASNFNSIVPAVRGLSQENFSGGWVPPPRTNGPPGKAPSRGEQNDYSQNFVDTGTRPQNFIRELELTSVVEDYPRLRELIQRKDEIVAKSASPPMYYKCDLREHVLSSGFFGTKFDVILIDPPWEEYVHRAPGVTDHMEHWTFEEIMNLKIEAIADTPSFIFLWVGDGVGLEQGRQCLKKWGFRRCEDICWVKTNKTTATPGLRHDSHTLYQHTKEHCLMGIKGTVRRSTDGHIIHANIDTDVIIAEEPPYGSTAKPEDMYRIIEHFALGRRRIELFGEDHNIRSGWLTVGKGLTSSNFNSEGYIRNFADKDGKVWLGGGGRNPPPEAPHLALTTPEIESLRPKSPMKNQQQIQQQQQQSSVAITLTSASSSNKRPIDNSINHNAPQLNQEGSISSNMSSPAPWNSQMVDGLLVPDGRVDMYPYNDAPFGPGSGDFMDYESNNRGMNMF